MNDPDEHFIPDEGDPWHQQQQELEQQEAEASAVTTDNTSPKATIEPLRDDKCVFPASGDPF